VSLPNIQASAWTPLPCSHRIRAAPFCFRKTGFCQYICIDLLQRNWRFRWVGCAGVADPSTTGLVYGLGVQYDVDSKIGVRAGYQSYASDASTIYAAALYNF